MEKGQSDMYFSWIEDSNEQAYAPTKVKRVVKHKKMKFVGWGSKPLFDFLKSNGRDCSKQLSQYDVATIIKEYVNRHNLLHPVKKKKIVCDEWLYFLFGKKTVPRIKIYDLLGEHFAENHNSSEDDLSDSSEELDEAVKSSSKKRKLLYEKKQVSESPKSCFAAIVPENIKCLYLKRSLVKELLKNTDTFEGKVVGSYVRIKSDPNDFSQKHSHQILPVTGVIRDGSDAGKEIQLQVPIIMKAIPIHSLTEEDFSEEECEDLRQRVKDGLIRRPTVVEFEQKTRILHEDITKHWLERELSRLRNLMDRANEKGWRRECSTMIDYSEKIQLLETPAEKTRRLLEVPKVVADELEPDPTLQAPINNIKQETTNSPTSILRDASISSADSGANQPIPSLSPDAEGPIAAPTSFLDSSNGFPVKIDSKATSVCGIMSTEGSNGKQAAYDLYQRKLMEFNPASVIQQQNGVFTGIKNANSIAMQVSLFGGEKDSQKVEEKKAPLVIELSDDEDEDKDKEPKNNLDGGFQSRILEHPESAIWYYMDPQGHSQGPFPMTALKVWYDAQYFDPEFKVWKREQKPREAVLLRDLLQEMFFN